MNDTIYLMLSLPEMYFISLGKTTGLEFLPVCGLIFLISGIVLSLIRREWRGAWFLLSIVLNQFTVGLIPWLGDNQAALFVLMAAQIALLIYLIFKMNGARLIASFLAAFSFSYTLMAYFIIGMALYVGHPSA
ncbi:MAG: hypothetical protein AAGC58_01485 [Asticcacaulis sp.]